MKKILVPTDTSDFGCMAIAHAESLAKALGAELIVIGIQFDPTPITVEGLAYTPPLAAEDFAQQLSQLKSELEKKALGAQVLVERAAGRPIWQAILEVAQSVNATMLVMTTHGRQGLSHIFLGSVAEDVVKHAKVPVMLIHGEQAVVNWS